MVLLALALLCLRCVGASPARRDNFLVGQPLLAADLRPSAYLSPRLNATELLHDPATAQAAASVQLGNRTSYAGFFTTMQHDNTTLGGETFWWHFPAENGDEAAPLLVWLQGGPGGSSMFGLFAENGPFSLTESLDLIPNPGSWNGKHAMLFIDNPFGAGFSSPFTEDAYCTNTKTCVAAHLYDVLVQFYTVFPEQQKNPLYITGESYAGHYVPAAAYYIHEQQQALRGNDDDVHVPLAGIAIGDGWVHPVRQLEAYPELMFNIGLADVRQKQTIQDYVDKSIAQLNAGDMRGSFDTWDEMLNGDIYPFPNYFHNISGLNDYDNYMNTDAPASFGYYAKYLNQPEVREALHIGNATMNSGKECELHLLEDFMVSFLDELETLCDSYKVLIYSGQLDVIIGPALTELYLPDIDWSGAEGFREAERKVWYVDSDPDHVAGYATSYDKLTYVLIRGAGHIAPADQPVRSLDMLERFIEGTPF